MWGGGQKIELIEAYNKEKPSPVDNYLRKQKDMAVPYHLCYEASDIEGKIQELQKEKFILVGKPQEAPAINGANVAFLYKRTVGLIELVEV